MTDSTEQAQARRLVDDAFTDVFADRAYRYEYEQRTLDLVLAATDVLARGDADTAEAMVREHLNHVAEPDLATYHVCGAAAIATGQLLDGIRVSSHVPEHDADHALFEMAVEMINSASAEDHETMTRILDAVWDVNRRGLYRLAIALLGVRAEVVALLEQEPDDA